MVMATFRRRLGVCAPVAAAFLRLWSDMDLFSALVQRLEALVADNSFFIGLPSLLLRVRYIRMPTEPLLVRLAGW